MLADADPLRHRTAGSKIRRGGALQVRQSSPAILPDSGVRTPAGRHKESPNFGNANVFSVLTRVRYSAIGVPDSLVNSPMQLRAS